MRRYLRGSLLVLLCTTLMARAAWADATTLAVLGIEPIEAPESLAVQLTDALRRQAAAMPGVKLVQGKDLIEIKMIFNCDNEHPNCMSQAGKSLGADKLLYGLIKRHGGRKSTTVVVGLKVLDVHSGVIEKFVNETVHTRDLGRSAVGALASRWLNALIEISKPSLTVTSDPPGSNVSYDGQSMGRTPVTLRDLAPGPHTIVVSQTGYLPYTKTVELKPGGSHEVVVSLEKEKVAVVTPPPVVKPPPVVIKPPPVAVVTPPPIVEPPPPITPPHPGRALRIIGFTAVGAAVVMGGVAIYTWRHYSDLQDTTHNELVQIRDATAAMPGRPNPQEAAFFNSPSCSPPASLAGTPLVTQYKNDCSSGTTFANTTTALWVVSGILAAGGVTAIIIGERQAAKARQGERSAGRLLRESLQVAPVVSTRGGGLTAAFEF